MVIEFAAQGDLDLWMRLVYSVKDSFPGLESEKALAEHRKTVLEFMARKEAICAKCEGRIVGALLFSAEQSMLCFLAVDAAYRRQHIAQKMTARMLSVLDPEKDVVVTTYPAGVPEGAAARSFYQHLGFAEGRQSEAFGSPVQEFVLSRTGTKIPGETEPRE